MLTLLAQITLNVTAIELLLSIVGLILVIASYVYAIKKGRAKTLDLKLDCSRFEEFKTFATIAIDKKAEKTEMQRFYDEIWSEVDGNKLSVKLDLAKLETSLDDFQKENTKMFMQISGQIGQLNGNIESILRRK